MTDLIKKVLESGLISWFNKQGNKQENRSTPWKWVVGIAVAAIAMLALSYLYLKEYLKKKEYAKLKHEVDVAEQKKHATELKLDIEENYTKIQEYSSTIDELDVKIQEIDEKLEVLDTELTKEVIKINAIKNWEEMDNYIRHLNDIFNTENNNSGHLN